MVLAFISLCLFVPPFMRYVLPVSSMTTGILIVTIFLLVSNFYILKVKRNDFLYSQKLSLLVCFYLCCHFLICFFTQRVNADRFFYSLPVVFVFLLAAALASKWIFHIKDEKCYPINYIFYTFIILGFFSIIGFQPESIEFFNKPVFPFTEPSHYAIALTPIFIYKCVITKRNSLNIFYLALGFTIAMFLQNLTMIAVMFLVASIIFSSFRLFYLIIILAFFSISNFDLTYFLDRLNFSESVNNLSTLVYIQGWQMIEESLVSSLLWGIGFQQLGENGTSVEASYIIQSIINSNLNLNDGSFVFSKLVSEMGMTGIVITLFYIILFKKCFKELRHIHQSTLSIHAGKTFAMSIVVAYSIELFFRGSGYFTGGSFLLITAILYLRRLNINA
jgi:hypothetical protein